MSPKIGMLVDIIRWTEKRILDEAKKRRVNIEIIYGKDLFPEISSKKNNFNDLRKHDLIIQRCVSYYRGLYLTAILEDMDIHVINRYDVDRICGDKLLTTLVLAKAGVPNPKTKVAFSMESALDALNSLGYPAIIKPLIGSWGRLVHLLSDEATALAVLEDREAMSIGMPLHRIFYLQEKIDTPQRDIRAFVIGGDVKAGMFRYPISKTDPTKKEWRTNYALGGTVEPCEITDEIREMSLAATKAISDASSTPVEELILGVDLVESPDLLVLEVNHTPEFRGLETASGVNVAGLIVDHLITQVKS